MNIKLTQGKIAVINDEDYKLVENYNWYAVNIHGKWYAVTRMKNFGRKVIFLHRFLLNVHNSTKRVIIDHKDGNGLNCRRGNIRLANNKDNSSNRKASGESKYLGVCFSKQTQNEKTYTYITAQITIDGKTKSLGSYKTEEEAAVAYDKAAKEQHGEFANLNFKENL